MVARRWLRNSIVVGIVLASFVSALAIAYELALARVPKHRAAMENLVRAQTGLDIRFNELALRWGWYGPEAVFRRVELGEPGRSNVLVRAPQLIVAINAWQTARAGRLVAGRITLISPDIDLERLTREPPAVAANSSRAATGANGALSGPATEGFPAEGGSSNTPTVRSKLLDKWKGGVIDLQGGTLRLPDPTHTASALTLQIRRAALRRAGKEWSGHALVLLPERLGRTARVVVQLNGDINAADTLSGGIRFEGVRLAFSSWRSVLAEIPKLATNLPLSGAGDVTFDLTLKDGRVQKADGRLRAVDLAVAAPEWLGAVSSTRGVLKLDYLTGDWRYARRAESSQLQIEQLVLSREQKDSPLPAFVIEMSAGHLRGSLASAPLRSLSAVAHWLAPDLAPDAVALEGKVEDVEVDWNPRRPEGFKLAASAKVDEALATSVTHGFSVKGLPVRLHATENRIGIEVDAPAAFLKLAADPDWPTESLALRARAFIERAGDGWRLEIPRFAFHDEALAGSISGTVLAAAPQSAPTLDLHGSLTRADVARAQELFAGGITRLLGGAGLRLANGRIENGSFEWNGPVDEPLARRFVGAFDLRNGRIPADDLWPEAGDLDARVEWSGSRVRAQLQNGQAGGFDLEAVEAQWDAAGEQPAHFTGRAHGRLEKALAWLRTHPELQEHVPHLQEVVASGDAMFDFDVTVPPLQTQPLTARVSTVLEGAQLNVAPDLPPVEALRGSIAYDSGKLQRSTLSATWLGGPLTLRIGERRDRKGVSVVVQAQGYVDARKLVALSQVRNLAQVSGETAWTGEFLYTPPSGASPARWQGRADSTLIGVASGLLPPLAKTANSLLPLHIEIIGTGDRSELRANLSDRLRAAFALSVVNREDWHIDRGAIRLGGGPAPLPTDETIQVRGHVKRVDVPAYVVAWQQLRKGAPDTHADIELSADELAFGDRVYLSASIQADASAIQIAAPALGTFTGTLMPGTREVVLNDLRLKKEALTGTGSLRCNTDLTSCTSKFELNTHDTAATLADLGFRSDLSAISGALSGEISWEPRNEGSWLASATGTLSMRFEDGTAHRPDQTTTGRPFPLFAVPELLSGIGGPVSRDIEFKRLEATFALRQGQATTSDLHFDGDAEILVRGRVGLLARDYDYEAWVLRGEERIPASVRRLPSAPRVAAAWLSFRDLVGGETVNRSRNVFHLRGTWSDPEVTSESR